MPNSQRGINRLTRSPALQEPADYQEDLHGKLPYIGAHRSKGMDFLGVILIDFPPFDQLAADPEAMDLQEAYFLGASRARQLLGIVEARGISNRLS